MDVLNRRALLVWVYIRAPGFFGNSTFGLVNSVMSVWGNDMSVLLWWLSTIYTIVQMGSQRAQYPLVKQYTLNHIRGSYMI